MLHNSHISKVTIIDRLQSYFLGSFILNIIISKSTKRPSLDKHETVKGPV